MKIGVRAHDFGKQSPEALAAAIKTAGFDAVQLALFKALDIKEEDMLKPASIDRIRRAFSDAGIEIAVLGCYVEPGSMDDTVYHASVEKFRAHIRIAKDLGAGCVATETTHFSGPEAARESAYARVLAFVREMDMEAERYDTLIAVEPVFAHTIHTPAMTARLIKQIASPRLRIIFDPVNMLPPLETCNQGELWEECIDRFSREIIALHIKDSRFEHGRHIPVPLGEGIMDFKPLLNWLKTNQSRLVLLREEANPVLAEQEIRFMKDLCKSE